MDLEETPVAPEHETTDRRAVRFDSEGTSCAAWHYPGSNGACVVMAGGFAVDKEPGTDRFAAAFHRAGFSVLAFDYRNTGASAGSPRQVLRMKDQLADWDAAIDFAGTLAEVDIDRIAIWGFSMSGGHVFNVAADHPGLAAAIAQSPNADGRAATRNALHYQRPVAMMKMTALGILDAVGGLLGRAPRLIALEGEPGTVALLTTPDAIGGGEALDPVGRYPSWNRAVAARSALLAGNYRPGRAASRVTCPLLAVVCDDDRSALAAPTVAALGRAPRGEIVHLPGGHYAPFLDQHQAAVTAELDFLRRTLLDP